MTDSIRFVLQPAAAAEALTESQAQVVKLGVGDRRVVYGSPGSGKTTALRNLALRLLQESAVSSDDLLVVAATRTAANKLRDDLALGFQGATSGPLARTLASFAFQVLRQRSLELGQPEPELISGSEQDSILAELIEELEGQDLVSLGWPSHINRNVIKLRGFRDELRDLVTVCLEHSLEAEDLADLGRRNARSDWVAASALLASYRKRLREPGSRHRFDASTLLDAARQVLTDSPGICANIRMVLVDDAQELTPAARALVKKIVELDAGLVLFGDPDAATLGFRAGDSAAMAELIAEVGSSGAPINLLSPPGNRSPHLSTALGNISFQLSSQRAGLQRLDYAVERQEIVESQTIEAKIFTSSALESAWLGRRIRELHLQAKIPWSQIAVVARSRVVLEQLEAALAAEEVPVAIRGSRSALRDEFASGELLSILDLALTDRELTLNEILRLLRSPFCAIDSVGLRRLRRALRRQELEAEGQRTSDELLLELFKAPGSLAVVKTREGITADRFVRRFHKVRELASQGENAETLLWQVWSFNSGDKQQAPMHLWAKEAERTDEIGAQMNRNLDAVVALFAAANRFVERNPELPAAEFVRQQLSLDLPEDSLALNYRDDERVSLLTPSALIGERFRVVVLPKLQEGLWPNLKPRTSLLGAMTLDAIQTGRASSTESAVRDEEQGELRMLHKAVGAASEKLLVSAIDAEEQQVSSFMRVLLTRIPKTSNEAVRPRLTLRGMAGDLRRRLLDSSDSHERLSLAYALAKLSIEKVPGAHPRDWYGLLGISTEEPLVATDGDEQVWLKPSQLEDFLTCPLHWFLNNTGGRDSTFEANLGTLLHTILEEERGESESVLRDKLEERWHELSFEADWLSKLEKRRALRMLSAMSEYLDASRVGETEVLGREVEFEFEYSGAIIRGTVDRIERTSTGDVVIIDLKTGKTVATQEQAKKHPQLGVYQLAFEKGAFNHVLPEDLKVLGGAKLLYVTEGKPKLLQQPSIQTDSILRSELEEMVARAATDMAMPQLVLQANIGTHCDAENSFAKCRLHLTRAVTYVG